LRIGKKGKPCSAWRRANHFLPLTAAMELQAPAGTAELLPFFVESIVKFRFR
jgi:hypothetical protein